MSASADALRLHFQYTDWATDRLLQQTAALPLEQLAKDFATSERTIVQTLAHIFLADRIWLHRVHLEASTFGNAADYSLAQLQTEWPLIQKRWREFLTLQTDASVLQTVTYRSLTNQEFTQPLWQILLHVVNHATHHRGQVTGFLRTLGNKPEPLDLIAFYRLLPAAPTPALQR